MLISDFWPSHLRLHQPSCYKLVGRSLAHVSGWSSRIVDGDLDLKNYQRHDYQDFTEF
jgi:hypothetical protein